MVPREPAEARYLVSRLKPDRRRSHAGSRIIPKAEIDIPVRFANETNPRPVKHSLAGIVESNCSRVRPANNRAEDFPKESERERIGSPVDNGDRNIKADRNRVSV